MTSASVILDLVALLERSPPEHAVVGYRFTAMIDCGGLATASVLSPIVHSSGTHHLAS